jgi:hypothetical protein
MPNWKKLIVSGSDASLNSLNVTNNVTAQSFTGSFSGSFTAPGATTQVVYNNGGALAASSNFVFSGSRVGIGTSTPTTALEISQVAPIVTIQSSDATQFHGIEFRNGGNLDAFIKQLPQSGEFKISNGRSNGWGGHITLYTDTAERMRITAAGNVGIGTTSPATALQVNGTARATRLNSTGGIIDFDAQTGNNFIQISSGEVSIANSGNVNMTITAAGNVGIGTSTPTDSKLEVNGNIGYTGDTNRYLFFPDTYQGTGSLTLQAGFGSALAGGAIQIFGHNTPTNSGSVAIGLSNVGDFKVQNYLGDSTKFIVKSTGNVGIGTTTPAAVLHTLGTGIVNIVQSNNDVSYTQYYNTSTNAGGTNDGLTVGNNGLTAYVWQRESADLLLGTSNTEAIRITSTGNVGIGTSSPGELLEVVGNIRANVSNGGGFMLTGASASGLVRAGATGLALRTNTTDRLTVDNSGNVGIGTTTPANNLHIYGTGDQIIKIENSGTYLMYAGLVSNEGYIGSSNATPLGFYTNNVNRIYINTSGNVGIGTTSPSSQLTLSKAAGNAMLQLVNADESAFSLKTYNSGSGTLQGRVFMQYLDYSSNINGYMAYHRGGGGSDGFLSFGDNGGERVRFANGGNVGIGTSSPGYKLEVVGAVSASTYYGDGSNLTGIGSGSVAAAGSDGQLQYNNSGLFGGASRLYYNDSTNRVGIGTSSPGYDLDVSGSARVQDRLRVGVVNTGNGVIHQSSDATINPSGATIVWSVPGSAGICAFIEYYVFNVNTGTSQRAGNIVTTWNAAGTPQITHTETTTPDVGSTTAITFTTTLTLGGDPQLIAGNTSGDVWYMVMNYRYF